MLPAKPAVPPTASPLPSLGGGYRAAVFGASGGLGAALVEALAADPSCAAVHAGSRSGRHFDHPRIASFTFDLEDEASLERAAQRITADAPPDLVLVATGLLHDGGLQPEKSLRALSAAGLLRALQINAVGPALIAKHLLPGLPRERRAIFAALSARVGSISDNRKGGWYGYRASKAALNQLLRTAAIELARTRPLAICVGLHPGTVDTRLSAPFQAGVPAEQLFPAALSAAHLLRVIDGLQPSDSGRVYAWDGREVPP